MRCCCGGLVWRNAMLWAPPPSRGFRFNPSRSDMWLAHKGLAWWQTKYKETQQGSSLSRGEEGWQIYLSSPENLNLLLLSIKPVTTTLTTHRVTGNDQSPAPTQRLICRDGVYHLLKYLMTCIHCSLQQPLDFRFYSLMFWEIQGK